MAKKFTTRYKALVIGLRLVIIMIADPSARIANKSIIIFSAVHCNVVSIKLENQKCGNSVTGIEYKVKQKSQAAGTEPRDLRYYPNPALRDAATS